MQPDQISRLVELCREHLRDQTAEGAAEDAWVDMLMVSIDEPEAAWQIIRELIRGTRHSGDLAAIGAGPLETFIRVNGSRFAAEIANEFSAQPAFREALDMVNGIWDHPGLTDALNGAGWQNGG